jgi:hypothetical protein
MAKILMSNIPLPFLFSVSHNNFFETGRLYDPVEYIVDNLVKNHEPIRKRSTLDLHALLH